MPADYRLYHVATAKILPGKHAEAMDWWRAAKDLYGSLPGVISIEAYANQFGLGPDTDLELWTELADYASFDRWDEVMFDRSDEFVTLSRQSDGVVEFGPARLVGDWPGSDILPSD